MTAVTKHSDFGAQYYIFITGSMWFQNHILPVTKKNVFGDNRSYNTYLEIHYCRSSLTKYKFWNAFYLASSSSHCLRINNIKEHVIKKAFYPSDKSITELVRIWKWRTRKWHYFSHLWLPPNPKLLIISMSLDWSVLSRRMALVHQWPLMCKCRLT